MTINFCYRGFQILELQKMGYLSSKTWGSFGKQVCNSCISPFTLLGLLTEDHSRVSFKIIGFFSPHVEAKFTRLVKRSGWRWPLYTRQSARKTTVNKRGQRPSLTKQQDGPGALGVGAGAPGGAARARRGRRRAVGAVCMSYISYVCDEPVGQCLAPMLLDLSIF